ncbi:AAA family ATPase, partial [Thermomonospora catenispora]|uniref:AAA family ATPase n=1 Tax=Thermomonospora catenispora TaxID=2493090 RepID=UPI0011219725
MRPVLLEMNGFASFREPAEVDFRGADYFALVGPTGSGKSTVVDAITFALYGSAPRWGNRRAVANALAPTADRGVVRLVFDVAGHRYIAARELRRVGDGVTVKNARLERLLDPDALGAPDDATRVLAADSAVTPAVERLLGMPFEHFATCVVLPQGAFAEFLHAQPAKRQDILVKLMGLEVYPRIAQAANALAEAERQRVDLLTRQLEGFADATDRARRAARRRVAALEKTAERVRAALPALAAHEAAATRAREDCATLTAERELLEAVVAPVGLEELAERDRAVSSAARAAAEELAEAEAADTAARERLAAAPPRSLLERTRRAHADLDALHRRTEKVEELHRRQTAALAAVAAARRRAASRARRARRELQSAERAHLVAALRPRLRSGRPCPVCERPVEAVPGPPPAPDLEAAERARLRADREAERLNDAWMRASRAEQSTADELAALAERLTAVRAALDGAPSAEQAAAELERRDRLEREAAAADAEVRRARAAKADAEQAAADMREETRAAWAAL